MIKLDRGEFARKLEQRRAQLFKNIHQVQNEAMFEGLKSLVTNSPESTGYYKANHYVLPTKARSVPLVPGTRPSGQGSAHLEDSEVLTRGLAVLQHRKQGSNVTIANGVPYAGQIESGDLKTIGILNYARAAQVVNEHLKRNIVRATN